MAGEPTEQDIARAVKELRRTSQRAVYLKRADHPTDGHVRTFFGGLPRLPKGVPWPRVTSMDGDEIAPTFVMQIQLEDMPSFAGRNALPQRGTLYFFVDTMFEGNGQPACKVIYCTGDAAQLEEAQPPPDLMLLSGYLNDTNHFWLDADEPLSRRDFRYAVEPRVFTSYRDWWDQPAAQWHTGDAHQLAYWRLQLESLEEAFGPRQTVAPVFRDSDEMPEGWPWTWGFVFHTARAFIHALLEYVDPSGWRAKRTPEDAAALYQRLIAEASAWRGQCENALGEAVAPEARSAFRDWFACALRDVHNAWSFTNGEGKHVVRSDACSDYELRRKCRDALLFSANWLLSQGERGDAAAHAARELLTSVGWKWTRDPNNDQGMLSIGIPLHQMLGFGQSVQGAPLEHASDVLLLQIAGDAGLAWHNNIGCTLQFWISPGDLLLRRFEHVQATLECD